MTRDDLPTERSIDRPGIPGREVLSRADAEQEVGCTSTSDTHSATAGRPAPGPPLFEQMVRVTMFLKLIDQGSTPEEAAMAIRNYLWDYSQ